MSERSAVWIRTRDGRLEILVEERFVEPDLISRWNLVFSVSRGVIGATNDKFNPISQVVIPEATSLAIEPCGEEYDW